MSVEEERERWEKEQKRRAAEKRCKEQERKKQQERKRHNAYVTKRGITDVKLYNAVVCAFGEEEATKIGYLHLTVDKGCELIGLSRNSKERI